MHGGFPPGQVLFPIELFPSRSGEHRRIVEDAVRQRTFTPIIGPECSTTNREDLDAWAKIRAEMVEVRGLFSVDEHRSYLDSLARENQVDLPEKMTGRLQRLGENPSTLRSLQVELVKAGAAAGKAFGEAMAFSAAPVTGTAGHKIKVPTTELRDCLQALVRACVYADRIPVDPVSFYDRQGVLDGLVQLTTELTAGLLGSEVLTSLQRDTGMSRDILSLARDLAPKNVDYRSEPASELTLQFYYLEWIADLVWYTFRVDAEAYPTNAELSFQVSLGMAGHQRILLSAGVQMAGDLRASEFPKWFEHYARGVEARAGQAGDGQQPNSFYDAIARYLRRQYQRYVRPSRAHEEGAPKEGPEDQKTDEPKRRRKLTFAPVAFSTTFDIELEKALGHIGGTYHVAIPVELQPNARVEHTAIWWLLGTVRDGADETAPPDWQWCPFELRDPENFPTLEGPLVIKLHGSPRHRLDDDMRRTLIQQLPPGLRIKAGIGRHGGVLKPALTLSEYEYLNHTVLLDDEVPLSFDRLLTDRARSLFLIGLPVSEWNTRLRIFETLYPRRLHDRMERVRAATSDDVAAASAHLPPPQWYTLNRHLDPARSSILASLSVRRWEGRHETLTGWINAAL